MSLKKIISQGESEIVEFKKSLSESKETIKTISVFANTAILLFGKNPQKFFPQVKIRAGCFKSVEGLDFIDMKILEGIILELQEKAMKFVMTHIKHAIFFDANRRYDRWEYSYFKICQKTTRQIYGQINSIGDTYAKKERTY